MGKTSDKQKAAELLTKSGIPASVLDGIVMIRVSPNDRAARAKIMELFKQIGYEASYGMSLNGSKVDKAAKYSSIGFSSSDEDFSAEEDLEAKEEPAISENITSSLDAVQEEGQMSLFSM